MASPERMIKSIIDEIRTGTAPVSDIATNQQTVIQQNLNIIALLEQIRDLLQNQPQQLS